MIEEEKEDLNLYSFIPYRIYGEHYETGERKILKESLYKEILENHLEYFEQKFPEYKIYIKKIFTD